MGVPEQFEDTCSVDAYFKHEYDLQYITDHFYL